MAQHPSDFADKFMLRLPEGMRDQIREEAEKNGRSMNSEIVARLHQSLAGSRLSIDEMRDMSGVIEMLQFITLKLMGENPPSPKLLATLPEHSPPVPRRRKKKQEPD